jgi:flagellar basal body-associated protein FliL
MQDKKNKRKQNILLLLVIGTALALAVYFQFFLSESADEVKTEITELVTKYNKNCPLTIQQGIRLDSVSLPKLSDERAVQYNLTLMNVEKETAEINVIHTEIEKSLLSTAKANPGLQVFRDNDYTLIYSYYDKKKVFLFDVKILPDQYK